ncbi:chorismate-binding protein [Cellulomonas palmilytica]|uniref:chorismate-binding protein n=1 Tax=Cellulomonas palmilytica TaxID=2608402 RepID=UPI001F1DB05B|nr:chorismate-binding protein [Cellulomonas palmilytica]UJP40233.1 chorismate-binding protein [Cellulomonas palmilytica]
MTAAELLGALLADGTRPFALVHRPAHDEDVVDLLVGDVLEARRLHDLPLHGAACSRRGPGEPGGSLESLVVVPYRQVTERGFAAVDDDEPVVCLTVAEHHRLAWADVVGALPGSPAAVVGDFDVTDEQYADLVATVLRDEIHTGAGANFVVHRSWEGQVADGSPPVVAAAAALRRLLLREAGAYWTFVIHTGSRTFVGASPERHVTLHGGTATMNPISGTYRYPSSGPTLDGVLDFLGDTKETDELNMVLDEEIKMMSRLCRDVHVLGPYLREMARLAHTEYLVEGTAEVDVPTLLRETMFAPTVTGSPIENACRVIAAHEGRGRGYYSGFAALVGRDASGAPSVDSAILIRTADVRDDGRLTIGVGATLVRHSDPHAEAAETRAKVAGVLGGFDVDAAGPLASHPDVLAALDRRGRRIADFWRPGRGAGAGRRAARSLARRPEPGRVLVLDAEDTFTHMLACLLTDGGWDTRIAPVTQVAAHGRDLDAALADADVVLLGPGPGDPRGDDDERVRALRAAATRLLARRSPFVAVCLGHQVTAGLLGLRVVSHTSARQGEQAEIDLFGARETVGFYNSYVARSHVDSFDVPGVGFVDVARRGSDVHALRGPFFATMQFHPESVLTLDGGRLLRDAVTWAGQGERSGRRPRSGGQEPFEPVGGLRRSVAGL